MESCMPTAAVPSLVLVDMGAPLQECLRRLHAQTARVAATLTSEQQDKLSSGTAAPSTAELLSEYRAAASDARGSSDSGTAQLCRRIALKLQRLRNERHIDLCSPTAFPDEAHNIVAALPAMPAGPKVPSEALGNHVKAPDRAHPPLPLSDDVQVLQGRENEDDVFGWVTQRPSELPHTARERAESPAPPPRAATAAVTADVAHNNESAVDALLHRIAFSLGDVVECKCRHAVTVEVVYQQLITLQRYAESLLNMREDSTGSTAESLGSRLRRLLAYQPSHIVASEEEAQAWQCAWKAMCGSAAPVLKVGTSVEMIDVAVLAHANVQRYESLQRRWLAVRQAYEAHVEQLNQRMALAALQLGKMEAMRKSV
ncbi:hypothetical protein, unknown function [Leishmania tarentolae]|uniref:Uncharacterized protein n=1 Tax=Leishmania tarentolae TaxID=5689 RepID=A0A640KIA2_LEITA|nr:hypothetical protein, unknown function [Leishmania tarentolae]